MVEEIRIGEKRCALILRASYRGEGIEFFTGDKDTLQLGYMRRARNYRIRPHRHLAVPRTIEFTNEVIYVKSGRVRIDFYDEDDVERATAEVAAGDVVLLDGGGHGFTMLEDAEMIEVKQGPFVGERDKHRFGI
jgi:hypothetical protein